MSQLHNRRVEKAGVFSIEKLSGIIPDKLLSLRGVDGEGDVEESGNDTGNIAVHDGCGLIEGKRAYRTCDISSHPREGFKACGIFRELP